MEVIKEDGLKFLVSLSLPYKVLEPQVNNKLVEIAKTAKVAGFRPGKLPLSLVKQNHGTAALTEVATPLMREHFFKCSVDHKLELAGIISIAPKQLDFDKELIYEVEFEVLPQIDVKLPADLKLELITATVEAADMELMVSELRRREAKYEDTIIGVAARAEHVAVISYNAETADEVRQQFSATESVINLSEEHPSAEFVAAIIGMRAGEYKSFSAKVLLNVPAAAEAKQPPKPEEREVNFKLTLHKLQRPVLPPLDREFFKKFGVDGDEQAFYAELKKNMEFELQQALNRLKYRAIQTAILQSSKGMLVPSTQVEREAQRLKQSALEMWQRMTKGKKPPSEQDLPMEMFMERAKNKVQAALFLSELAKIESLEPTEAEIQQSIETMSQVYENPAEVKQRYESEPSLRHQIFGQLLEEKAMNKFIDLAKAKTKKVSYREAIALSAALDN